MKTKRKPKNSISNHSTSSSEKTTKVIKKGRPMLEITRILLKFWKPSKNSKGNKETFCINLRRATEKLLRFSFDQKILRPIAFLSYLKQFEIDDLQQKIRSSVKMKPFEHYSWGYKMHSVEGLKAFFIMNGVKKAFKILKEKMKLGRDIGHFCKRFKLLCCFQDKHTLECQAKWRELFIFLDNDFIDFIVKDKDLGFGRSRNAWKNLLVLDSK